MAQEMSFAKALNEAKGVIVQLSNRVKADADKIRTQQQTIVGQERQQIGGRAVLDQTVVSRGLAAERGDEREGRFLRRAAGAAPPADSGEDARRERHHADEQLASGQGLTHRPTSWPIC